MKSSLLEYQPFEKLEEDISQSLKWKHEKEN